MEKGWIEVFLTGQEYQAIIAKDLLESSGIQAVILNQHDSTYLTFGAFAVFIPEESFETAMELLKELKS